MSELALIISNARIALERNQPNEALVILSRLSVANDAEVIFLKACHKQSWVMADSNKAKK
jgi:hypothetical protein